MKIKRFEKKDWDKIRDIYKSGIETGIATFESNLPSWEKFDKDHLDFCRLAAVENEKIIGWIALSLMNDKDYYSGVAEVSIYIHEDFRNKGVGKVLLQKAIEDSEKNGLWTLQAKIIEDNISSIKLHKKCGFKLVGIREKLGRDKNGTFINVWLFEKRSEKQGV